MSFYKYIFLITTVFALVACGGADERKAQYLEKAEASIAAGDLDKARIELKNVLQIDPKDVSALFKLGEVFEKKKDFRKAFSNYTRASELEPSNTQYQSKLGEFYLYLSKDVKKAEEILAQIKKIDSEDEYGLMLEASIAVAKDDIDTAMLLSNRVYERDPGILENAIFISDLYKMSGDSKKARQILLDLIDYHDGDTRIASLVMTRIASYSVDLKEYDKAETLLKKVVESDPDNANAYVNLAKFYLSIDKKDAAVEALQASIQNNPEDVNRRLELVSLKELFFSVDMAIDETKVQIDEVEVDGVLRLKLAQLLIKSEKTSEAKDVLAKLIDLYGDEQVGIKARLVLSDLNVAEDDMEAAEKYVTDAYNVAPNDSDVNLYMARIALASNNIDQSIISLRTVIKDDPDNIRAHITLSEAHRMNGEVDQAEDVLDRAYQQSRNKAADLLEISKTYLKHKDNVNAEKVIDDFLTLKPEDYEGLSIKASVLNLNKKHVEAMEYARKAIDHYKDNPNGYVQIVPGLIVSGKAAEAEKLLADNIASTGYDGKMLVLLTRIKASKGDIDGAASVIRKAIASGMGSDGYALLAKLYSDNKRYKEAGVILDEALEQYSDNDKFYLLRAKIYESTGEAEKVKPLFEDALPKLSNINKVGSFLATVYERGGEYKKAIELNRKVLLQNPDNILVANNLAAMLVESDRTPDRIEEALKLTEKLSSVDQPAVKDTVAWVYYHAGKYTESADLMKTLVTDKPDVNVFNYHYGMVLKQLGDLQSAKTYLAMALKDDVQFNGRDEAFATLASIK